MKTAKNIENSHGDVRRQFLEFIKDPPKSFRPIAFWFLNHRLEDEELIRQIHEMNDKGLGGFMLHARDGLRTSYLGDDWEHAVAVCITEAERLDMDVWLYDENHYPSGPAGGLLKCRFPDRTMESMALVLKCDFKAGSPIELEIPKDSFETPVGWGSKIPESKVLIPIGAKPIVLISSL
ncbi:MAG: hypothetical protein WC657_06510, partial [Candidatus Paceibacterota bacterium]